MGTAAPADCDLVAQNCPLSPSAHLVIGSCIPRGCDLMGTHTRPICTVRRPAARQDVGDTTNRPRTHYKRPLNPEKTRQSHYPTPWAPSWVVFGAFAAKRFWVYFATGGATFGRVERRRAQPGRRVPVAGWGTGTTAGARVQNLAKKGGVEVCVYASILATSDLLTLESERSIYS